MAAGAGHKVNLLVVASPDTPELSVLQQLPPEVKVVATGQTLAELSKQLTDEQWGTIDCILNCGVGKFAGKREYVQVTHSPWWGGITVGLSASACTWNQHLRTPVINGCLLNVCRSFGRA